MKSAVVVTHSRYPKTKLSFYRKLCRGKFKIAVDGGYIFFKQAKMKPDLIIGDFDSLKRSSVKNIKTLAYPIHKDHTDTELAIRYCIEKRFNAIDIVMPAIGEPDHFMGLISILANPSVRKRQIRIINHKYEIRLLENEKIILNNGIGQKFSIKAVCKPIKLNCSGTKYPAKDLNIQPWQSTGLRNYITDKKARIEVKGRALFFRYHAQSD